MSIDALRRAGLPRMRPRDPDEPHRATSSLELFFDLAFAVMLRPSLGAAAYRAVPALAVIAGSVALLPGGVQWRALAVVAVVTVLEVDRRRIHRGAGTAS